LGRSAAEKKTRPVGLSVITGERRTDLNENWYPGVSFENIETFQLSFYSKTN
jgi:hypothetical protein